MPAELFDTLFHKRGALCAARTPDQVNPQRSSSGSQFYIVQGNLRFPVTMDTTNSKAKPHVNTTKLFGRTFTDAELDRFEQMHGKKYTAKQRNIYKTQGGSPHLDYAYTVFGEVVQGMEVVDIIAEQPVDKNNKPLKEVKMAITILE
ncbi:MAG: peptidylprolyl isomerase [Lentimicrobiaceae bacterium]|nr:peptidylprolyl isomerase [Lentimicrobiaceae bacterium]